MTATRTQIRTNLLTALRAVVGLRPEDGVQVVALAAVTDILYYAGDRVLGVARTGGDLAGDGEAPLLAPGSQMRTLDFVLAMKVDCPLDNAETLTMAGGAEELMETACQAIQRVDVGLITTGPIYVRARSEEVLVHPHRVAGEGGGPIALAHRFTTTEFEL